MRRTLTSLLLGCLLMGASLASANWSGDKTIRLHGRDGKVVAVGSVRFTPSGDRTAVRVTMDIHALKDFFLSMREFKCLEGGTEVLCHVPYPYKNPGTITPTDLGWLEHQLLFFYKQPSDFGAKLWNGVYYRLTVTDKGLVGTPQAIDLNAIGAPPARTDVPPYSPAERNDVPAGARWFDRLTID